MKAAAGAARLAAGAALAYAVARALAAPEPTLALKAIAVLLFAVTAWRPAVGIVAMAALAGGASLLAPPPARPAELVAWTFLAAWLLAVWRPLAAGWARGLVLPAALLAACAAASWIGLGIAGAAGVAPAALPIFLVNSIPADYLVFSTPQTQTWTALQLLAGVAALLAAAAAARAEPRVPTWMAWTLVGATTALAAATLADVARQWAANDYGAWFLARYLRGERFSLHLADVNATGSQYVLAGGVAAALAALDRTRRWRAAAAIIVMLPAFWLTGSRTAFLGAAAAAAAIVAARSASRVTVSRRQLVVAGAVLALVVAGGVLVSARAGGERGSAAAAMRMRSQFSETSARMIASAPVFGVGIGRYFERSPEFMPADLRALYGAENAHNYYAQVFAELGFVGGLLFLWLLGAGLYAAWRAATLPGSGPARVGLFAGVFGYLATCATGHPFLVAETALPFWAAFGTAAGAATIAPPPPAWRRAAAAVGVLLLVVAVGRSAAQYAGVTAPPPDRGFERTDTAGDGTMFQWMSPHATVYAPRGPGFFRMTMRPPDRPLSRPVTVETSIGGRVVDRRELAAGRWETVEIPVRDTTAAPFRRVDVRAAPSWAEKRRLAQRRSEVDVALTIMVSEVRWVRAGG